MNAAAPASQARPQSPQRPVRIGLIGGMSWRSTALYYERLNRALEQRVGSHQSLDGVIWNLNYAILFETAMAGDWRKIEAILCEAGEGLAKAGCDYVVLTAVTAHRFRDAVTAASQRPVPHVLDGPCRILNDDDVRKVGVLGTSATCASPFIGEYLGASRREVLLLDADRQSDIEALIQNVLTTGTGSGTESAALRNAVEHMQDRGAQAVVLACTELPLLLPVAGATVPMIDSVACHVDDICNLIMSDVHAE